MKIQIHYPSIKVMTKLLALLFITLVSAVYAEDDKTELLKKKSIELTDFVYSEVKNLHPEDREYIEEESYIYLKDLVKLLEKDLDRSTSKFQFQFDYLNKTYTQTVSKSIIGGRSNGGGAMVGRNGGGRGGKGGRGGGPMVVRNNNKNTANDSDFRKKLKTKVASLLNKDFDLNMPTGGKKKEK